MVIYNCAPLELEFEVQDSAYLDSVSRKFMLAAV